MPISEEEWKQGRSEETFESTIYKFLKRNYPNAYSVEDISANVFENTRKPDSLLDIVIFGIGESALKERIRTALDSLINEGLVEKKTIEEEYGVQKNYYRAKQK